MWNFNVICLAVIFLTLSCNMEKPVTHLSSDVFGTIEDQDVMLFTVEFPGKLKAKITNYGGILTHLEVPDARGKMGDIVLGYDRLDKYIEATPYFGAIVGRYGNRIANGSFMLDGETYDLAKNNGPNALHGGIKGFDKVVWEVVRTFDTQDSVGLVLKYVSPHMEEGYPGTLASVVTYTFTGNEFKIQYSATSDRKTVVNLTQHSYFNLAADPSQTILDHEVKLDANRFVPVDSTLIPTGELAEVAGTPFDFRVPKKIGLEINVDHEQIQLGGGYDHCWVLNSQDGSLKSFAMVVDPVSGRTIEVLTTEPGVQFYTGNFLDGSFIGKNDIAYEKRSGFCLETQHFPDSPNQPGFPPVSLAPGEVYESQTIYRFGAR